MNDPGNIYIDRGDALRALTERLKPAARVALDTEADSLHSYYEKVCLIQVAAAGEIYIVDPLAGLDLSEFIEALAGKEIIFHGADYDLRILRSAFGFRARRGIFDTMLAAQLLGHERLGLAALVGHFFGAALNKRSQKFDWSRRPLPETEIRYAGNDVRYLEPLADRLRQRLHALGREEWHRETCEALARSTERDRPPRDPEEAWRIKGLHSLNRRQLAYVRELWRWREREAQQADIPPFKVLGNLPLRELAFWADAHPGRPAERGLKLPRTCKGERLEALNRALGEARRLPGERWPELKPRRGGPRYIPLTEREARRLDELRAARGRIAAELGLAPSVLASQAELEAVVRGRPGTIEEIREVGNLTRWQAELLAPVIAAQNG